MVANVSTMFIFTCASVARRYTATVMAGMLVHVRNGAIMVFLQSLRRWLTRDSVCSSYSLSAQILPQRSDDSEDLKVTSTRIDCAALPDSMTSQLTHHPIRCERWQQSYQLLSSHSFRFPERRAWTKHRRIPAGKAERSRLRRRFPCLSRAS
jgi:hypothetical protein